MSPWRRSPVSYPFRNHRTRCSDVPWVNESGTTWPWAWRCKVSSPTALAARTSTLTGRPLRADAFRKQVSRARFMLAKLLVREVIQTLDRPTPEQVKEELVELSLWEYVRDFLPPQPVHLNLRPERNHGASGNSLGCGPEATAPHFDRKLSR